MMIPVFDLIQMPEESLKHPAERTIPLANVEVAVPLVMFNTDASSGPVNEEDPVEETRRFWVELKLPPVKVNPLDEDRPAVCIPPAKVDVPIPWA